MRRDPEEQSGASSRRVAGERRGGARGGGGRAAAAAADAAAEAAKEADEGDWRTAHSWARLRRATLRRHAVAPASAAPSPYQFSGSADAGMCRRLRR